MLEIVPLILGPVATNAYLIADSDTGEAAVIDPAWDGHLIAAEARRRNWQISQIWITHAHFDHIGGAGDLARELDTAPVIALHPDDRLLWDTQGGAALFGFTLPASPAPTLNLAHEHGFASGPHNLRGAPYSRAYSRALCLLLCGGRGLLLRGSHLPKLRRPHGSARRGLGDAGNQHPLAGIYFAR